ncbi:unnamed protein product [Protopolystoma xenopodis]|uniref:Uncharacterized protein n=1 Tax=Protopolystoma xenopodis TaxID=117903 RepID=A0A3S5A7L4_9PLAT|nr:unnamed protein product [Protopolystoma xenopodis]
MLVLCDMFVFVAALETGSIGVWIYRLAIRNHRLRTLIRFLKVADIYNAEMDPLLMRFERTFLRLDGNFLLHMLRLNAGEIVTQDILQAMLQRYKQQEDMALKANQQLMQPTKQLDYATERDQITAGLITRQVNDSDCTIKKRADT